MDRNSIQEANLELLEKIRAIQTVNREIWARVKAREDTDMETLNYLVGYGESDDRGIRLLEVTEVVSQEKGTLVFA